MVRTPSCDKSGMRKGTWTPEEDMKLIAYVTRYGCWNWRQLPKFAGLARCGKSCRLRWMNYLRPNIKRGNFTQQEEECIIRMHKKLGNRWSAIAVELPGRTDNEIKNHWHTALKKRSQQNTLINEETKAIKSKNKESVHNNGVFVTLPATSQISDNSSLSPVSSTCSEFSSITSDLSTAASCMENLVLEDDDLGFLDLYNIDPMNGNLWTELNLDGISFNTPCEIVSGDTNSTFQSSSSSNSNTLDSPHQSTSESIVVNNDFGRFLDSYEEATVDNFWTQSYVADMSHVPSELFVPSVAESEYFTPLYDDLWGQTHLYHENHCLF